MRTTWDPTVPAFIAAIAMLVGTVAATGGIAPGQWRGKAGSDPQSVRLDIRLAEGHSETRITTDVAAAELDGFDAEAFGRAGAPLRLAWKRDAGTFLFEGEGGRRPGGTVRFEPDPTFAERWRALGFGDIAESDYLRMAVEDVRLADAEQLKGLGVRVGLDDILRLRAHGVSTDDVRAFRSAGVLADVESVIRLKSRGIDAAYVKGMIDAGVPSDDLEGIQRLHAHGVPTEYAAQVRSSGFPDVDVDDLVRLHDQGVDSEYVRGLVESQLPGLTVDAVVRLHSHGVPADFVRSITQTSRRDVTVEEVIRAESAR